MLNTYNNVSVPEKKKDSSQWMRERESYTDGLSAACLIISNLTLICGIHGEGF